MCSNFLLVSLKKLYWQNPHSFEVANDIWILQIITQLQSTALIKNWVICSLEHDRMREMKHHHHKSKDLLMIWHSNHQNWLQDTLVQKWPTSLWSILLQYTYGAVPDVQKHLLSLLWPTDYIREAGSFLRCHTVMWKSTLESCTLHTYNKKTSCLQALQWNCYRNVFGPALLTECT